MKFSTTIQITYALRLLSVRVLGSSDFPATRSLMIEEVETRKPVGALKRPGLVHHQ